jgi:hypothetical protein
LLRLTAVARRGLRHTIQHRPRRGQLQREHRPLRQNCPSFYDFHLFPACFCGMCIPMGRASFLICCALSRFVRFCKALSACLATFSLVVLDLLRQRSDDLRAQGADSVV